MIKNLWNYFLGNAKIVEVKAPTFEEHPPKTSDDEVKELLGQFENKDVALVFDSVAFSPEKWEIDEEREMLTSKETGIHFYYFTGHGGIHTLYKNIEKIFVLCPRDALTAMNIMRILTKDWNELRLKEAVRPLKPRIRVKCETRKI